MAPGPVGRRCCPVAVAQTRSGERRERLRDALRCVPLVPKLPPPRCDRAARPQITESLLKASTPQARPTARIFLSFKWTAENVFIRCLPVRLPRRLRCLRAGRWKAPPAFFGRSTPINVRNAAVAKPNAFCPVRRSNACINTHPAGTACFAAGTITTTATASTRPVKTCDVPSMRSIVLILKTPISNTRSTRKSASVAASV